MLFNYICPSENTSDILATRSPSVLFSQVMIMNILVMYPATCTFPYGNNQECKTPCYYFIFGKNIIRPNYIRDITVLFILNMYALLLQLSN